MLKIRIIEYSVCSIYPLVVRYRLISFETSSLIKNMFYCTDDYDLYDFQVFHNWYNKTKVAYNYSAYKVAFNCFNYFIF
jgi:hypothetical protein